MNYQNALAFAKQMDAADPLKHFRKEFYFPKYRNREVIYFTGNSLGLQPKTSKKYFNAVLKDWAKHGVEGHFEGDTPWLSYHEALGKPLAKLTGSKPSEVVAMNHLTSNIHFLLVSFYKPTIKRYKILCEAKAFPSDQYLLASQAQFHGYNPDEAIIEIAPRTGEHNIRSEDILTTIEKHKHELALIFFGGINYFTGQVFDMKRIAKTAHKVGIPVGFDLAHAIGNIKLNLHEWDVDFAAWCSYKYLNSGPGNIGGIFIHEKHHRKELPRFAGWWGHDKNTRFNMGKNFSPIPSAEGWQVSTANTLGLSIHRASLDIFERAGMDALLKKSKTLTDYLAFIIECVNTEKGNPKKRLEIITPKNEKGCQLSVIAHGQGKNLFHKLMANGVIPDWREPNVIRMAPVPLYNSFEDIYRFGEILKRLL
ncbi:MAG: kynureninase [Bacteroidia bacterium]|nr:kynureninase [Bacteroidia bacterium]